MVPLPIPVTRCDGFKASRPPTVESRSTDRFSNRFSEWIFGRSCSYR